MKTVGTADRHTPAVRAGKGTRHATVWFEFCATAGIDLAEGLGTRFPNVQFNPGRERSVKGLKGQRELRLHLSAGMIPGERRCPLA
jgi:hypothetical protein